MTVIESFQEFNKSAEFFRPLNRAYSVILRLRSLVFRGSAAKYVSHRGLD